MFDRLSIRTKLIAMVGAPLVVIVLLAGLGYTQRRDDATATRADVRRLEAIDASLALQYEIEIEGLYSVGFLASDGELHADDLGAQQARTDEATDAYEQSLAELEEGPAARAGQSSVRQIRFLDLSLRRQVEKQALDWPVANQIYQQLLAALLPVNDRLAAAVEDGEIGAGARSVVSLGQYSATVASIGAVLQGAAAEGGFPSGDTDVRGKFLDAVARSETELAVVGAQADPDVRTRLRNQMVGGDVSYFSDQIDFVSRLEPGTDLTIDAARWSDATEATLAQLRDITASEADATLAAANDRVAQSESAARLFLAAALLIIVLAVGLALYVAASIARPLLSLTHAADEVANEQLPRMVEALRNPTDDSVEHLRPELTSLEVGGGKELAALSASVSSIQEVAVQVGTEQAALLRKGIGDMFVNLARRNQALLDRQLEFIDDLEAEEEDPDDLEALFKLDHMATRMRRNAESLLVLAGAEPSRRRGRPVPLTKVTLAAVGEIEHFARVDLLEVDECEVTSKAAADIAHLLSELMENATQFSPPETRVEVVGHRMKAGGYTISITDQGIGMSPSQLSEGNEMLARPPLLGLTLARSLGFIVVGRLAARHKITIRLVASPAGGVTAIVGLPSAVLVGDPAPDTLDLTFGGPAPSSSALRSPNGRSTAPPSDLVDAPPNPSSILPPFEFASFDPDDDVDLEPDDDVDLEPEPTSTPSAPDPVQDPATLEEAVPTGRSFDEDFDQVAPAEGLVGATDPATAGVTALFGPEPATTSREDGGPEPLPEELVSPMGRSTTPDAPILPTRKGGSSTAPAPAHQLFGTPQEPGPAPVRPSGGTHLFRTPPAAPVDTPQPTRPRPAAAPAEVEDLPGAPTETTGPTPATREVTAAGLVRRVPRSAGARRAVPGSGGGDRGGATTSVRSPDEVRSMLSRFHSGRQAAQGTAPDDPPSGASGPAPSHPEDN